MNNEMRIYWEVFFKEVETNTLIKEYPNPLREYESEFIKGAVLDFGCGQSNILLEYSNSGRTLYAIDDEEIQLRYLKERAVEISNDMSKWRFINSNFVKDALPEDIYSVVILSNILHFFSLDESMDIEKKIRLKLQKGSIVYISVHSTRFPDNNSNNPDNNNYFKHYYTTQDIEKFFNKEEYDTIYIADIVKNDSKLEKNVSNKWLDILLATLNITDDKKIELAKESYFSNKYQADIQFILRKR